MADSRRPTAEAVARERGWVTEQDRRRDTMGGHLFRCDDCGTAVRSTCPDPTIQPCDCGGVARLVS